MSTAIPHDFRIGVDANDIDFMGHVNNASSNGDSAPLKAFAKELVPTVTAHLNMAKAL